MIKPNGFIFTTTLYHNSLKFLEDDCLPGMVTIFFYIFLNSLKRDDYDNCRWREIALKQQGERQENIRNRVS